MKAVNVAFVSARLAFGVIFILTWAYGVTTLSPFAFDMFVKPRLFPWLETFVNWHHLWCFAAFLLSAATLLPLLVRGWRGQPLHVRAAWWASAGYVAVFGVIGAYLLSAPRLPLLTSGARDPFIVPGALVPLLWLAVIDHLDGWPRVSVGIEARVTGQRRLLATCLGTASWLWLVNLGRAATSSGMDTGVLESAMAHAWAFAIIVSASVALYLLLILATAVAATARQVVAVEYGLAVLMLGVGITELFRRVVFPPLMLGAVDAIMVAVPFGVVIASMFAGLSLQTSSQPRAGATALDLLIPFRGSRATRIAALVTVPIVVTITLGLVDQIDWAMTLRRLLVITEAALILGLFLHSTQCLQDDEWSMRRLAVAPVAALVALHGFPILANRVVVTTGEGRVDPQQLIDRYQSTDALTFLAAGAFLHRTESKPGFYSELLDIEARLSNLVPIPPKSRLPDVSQPPSAPVPHVFVFVIDSLRRDYLSPYNEAVTFTPSIDRWARDQYVFRNAFTQYGGTWLAVPSIWTGSAVTRRWAAVFRDINAIEPLLVRADYDIVINDYTIAGELRPETQRTFLDPSIPSVDTDLCRNLESLEAHIESRTTDRPVFAYLAPMNVHILNTRTMAAGAHRPDEFYAPYASRLERLDGCFGSFMDFLEARGMSDDSVVVLTSDHGDSLGDEGRWGHQFYLFPEDIRIPLIVQLPADRRASLTTDLGRISFLSDIAPTLYALLGYQAHPAGAISGTPLFVAPDETPHPRRRDAHLVMSSYGSSYGVLRRNGRFLYFTDLVNRKESAFSLFQEPVGEPIRTTDALRRVNRKAMLEGLVEVEKAFTPP